MQATFDRKALLSALKSAALGRAKSSYMPILAQALLEVSSQWGTIICTDLDKRVSVTVPVRSAVGGTVILPLYALLAVLNTSRADDVRLEVEAEGPLLRVLDGTGASLACLALPDQPDEFPLEAPDSTTELGSVSVNPQALREALEAILPSVAREPGRNSMHGIRLESGTDRLKLVATDGKRLAIEDLDTLEAEGACGRAIVPLDSCKALLKSIGKRDTEPIVIRFGDGWARFQVGPVTILARALDGEFPRYTSVVPALNREGTAVQLRADDALEALAGASAILDLKGDNPTVRLEALLLEQALSFIAKRGTDETSVRTAQGTVTHQPAKRDLKAPDVIAFNALFLRDALKAYAGQSVTLQWAKKTEPMALRSSDGRRVHVIMPVTLG